MAGVNIDRYVTALRDSLEATGRAGGAEVAEAADRLSIALEPSVRLVTLQVLADAADEITSRLGADPSVEVRLRGADAELVVVAAPRDAGAGDEDGADLPPWGRGPGDVPVPPGPVPPAPPGAPWASDDLGDTSQTRITLRIPAPLKSQIDEAAASAGVSVNTWLVRAAQAALVPGPEVRQPGRPGKRLTGWAT